MIDWISNRLVPEASEWWRLGSVQLAAGVAALGAHKLLGGLKEIGQ